MDCEADGKPASAPRPRKPPDPWLVRQSSDCYLAPRERRVGVQHQAELPPPKGRRDDLGRVRVAIEDAEGGTVEVEDDDDMADAADARCVHVRGWPL